MKKRKNEFSIIVKNKVITRSGNRCERCNIPFCGHVKGEFHHIQPIAFGGDKSAENCSHLCKKCHKEAPNVQDETGLLVYKHYFLRFASYKEATEYYKANSREDLWIKAAFDLAKSKNKK